MKGYTVIKKHAVQIISVLALAVLAAAVLAAWQAWRVLAVPPDADTAALEARIDQVAVRYPQWELEMDARYLACEQKGDRLYVAFANEAQEDALWGAIFVRHPLWGWEVAKLESVSPAASLAFFEDWDYCEHEQWRAVVIGDGTGGDAACWELRRMDNDAFVYGEAASDAPFVHVEDGVQTLLCRYDADGARLRDPLQQGHGYHVKHHTNWFENVHIEVIL